MTTAARPTSEQSSHWYFGDGRPCYEVERADGKGMRPTTLRDARKLSLLPSVTTILGMLHKEALVQWRVEQAVLACLTSPRQPDETLDYFVDRVLHQERVQDQESDVAKQRGTDIHAALEGWAMGCPIPESLRPWVVPVAEYLDGFGKVVGTEQIVVSSDGYAGKTDLLQRRKDNDDLHVWDFKTTKKLPKGEAWSEHRLQLSAYANALYEPGGNVSTGNIYISTVEPGAFMVCQHKEPWYNTYGDGFEPLLRHWQWANDYRP